MNGDPPRASNAGRAAAPTVSAENPPGPTTTYGVQDPVVPTAGPALLTGASDWPEFAALREAASGSNMSKFRRLAGVLITSARVAFAAALAKVGHGEASQPDSSTAKAASYYAILATVASESDRGLQDAWHWPEAAALTLERFAARLIGGPEPYAIAAPHLPSTLKSCTFQGPASAFEHRLPFFFAALACGWQLQPALDLFGTLGAGVYSENGCCFCVAGSAAPDASARRHVITAEGFQDGILL